MSSRRWPPQNKLSGVSVPQCFVWAFFFLFSYPAGLLFLLYSFYFFLFASREFLCEPICVSLCLYVLFFLVLFYNVGFHFSFDSSHQGEGARRSQKTALPQRKVATRFFVKDAMTL